MPCTAPICPKTACLSASTCSTSLDTVVKERESRRRRAISPTIERKLISRGTSKRGEEGGLMNATTPAANHGRMLVGDSKEHQHLRPIGSEHFIYLFICGKGDFSTDD